MQQKVKARSVLNPHVIKMFARGAVLKEPEQVSQIQKMLQNALDEFSQQDPDWDQAMDQINSILIKKRHRLRLYPAGIIPYFQYPITVIYHLTGRYCLVFELIGLTNSAKNLELPTESNMSDKDFKDFLVRIIGNNRAMGNSGLSYELITKIQKIPGLSTYGITTRQNPKSMGNDLLVIAKNPFGTEYRFPLKAFHDRDLKHEVKCSVDIVTQKKIKITSDGFFIWQTLKELAQAWPQDKLAMDFVKKVENIFEVLKIRAVTKDLWHIDKKVYKDRNQISIGWMSDNVDRKADSQPGTIILPVYAKKGDSNRLIFTFKGLTDKSARSIESICKREHYVIAIKSVFSSSNTTEIENEPEAIKAVTFRKAPRELSQAILKCLKHNFNMPFSELKQNIQLEMERMHLKKDYKTDSLMIKLESKGPAIYVLENVSDQAYKFIIERRVDEEVACYGLIQVDEEDDEIRRFTLSRSQGVINKGQ